MGTHLREVERPDARAPCFWGVLVVDEALADAPPGFLVVDEALADAPPGLSTAPDVGSTSSGAIDFGLARWSGQMVCVGIL